MKIALGSDHGGFEVKESVRRQLEARGVEVQDFGTHSRDSVDYPDYAREVATRVSEGEVDQGVLVCTTGLGMSMAANKYPRVRAALCMTPEMASKAREHNNANVLVLGGALTTGEAAAEIVTRWMETPFSGAERHARRVRKISEHPVASAETAGLFETDPETWRITADEIRRQQMTLDLIASENHVSKAVRESQGSVMTNKYAEGYPGRRWYNGCRNIDAVEALAIERGKALFSADHVNVQPHCGSAANMAVYFSVLEPGDTILAMTLAHGGHLTHGHDINFSGRLFNVVHYGVDRETELIDYDALDALAREHKPRLIVAGASAYPRLLDFERFRAAADSVGAMLMTDMAHFAGLVAGGAHPSPVPHCEFVTSTTHKTLRGPRSGLILCREAYAAGIDRQVFPGIQGGPLIHAVAAKAVCFLEAAQPGFRDYAHQIVANARAMAEALQAEGFRLVSGGTDNHLMLVDLSAAGITGRDAANALETAGIVANKNAIPFDTRSPLVTSGIRLGTPAVTTRGMREDEMRQIAAWIVRVVRNAGDAAELDRVRREVEELAAAFPAP